MDRITYSNVCIRDAERSLVLETHYDNPGPRQDVYPVFCNIRLEQVRMAGGGKISVDGLDADHRLSLILDGVTLDDPRRYVLSAAHAMIRRAPER